MIEFQLSTMRIDLDPPQPRVSEGDVVRIVDHPDLPTLRVIKVHPDGSFEVERA